MSRRLLVLALALPLLGGCATKRDLRDLRTEIQSMQAQQEALLREIQRQNGAILDSLNIQEIRLRGDLGNQLVQMERQLLQIQELTGQGQQQLAEVRQTLREREEAIRAAEAAGGAGAMGATGDPAELFATAEAALERSSLTAARAGFEEFLRLYPEHARAPEAQLAVGQTYEQAEDAERALDAYARVLELYPNSPQAPTALLRAALLEADDDEDRARSMLNQIIAAYPRSPEAPLAREELRRMR
jgi:tol-pal system protein YbgF